MAGTDVYVGLSRVGALKPEMMKDMAANPLILALSNPIPEIMPELAREARPDAIICTGRSDHPNQVNNVLCFPFLFRGGGRSIAARRSSTRKLRRQRPMLSPSWPMSRGSKPAHGMPAIFGPDYLIPNPFDQRLILRIAPAVAKAAIDSGVAKRPITDFAAYCDTINRFVFHSGLVMKPMIERAQARTSASPLLMARTNACCARRRP